MTAGRGGVVFAQAAAAAGARTGFPGRRGGGPAREARARFCRAIWARTGARRLPSGRELDAALSGLPAGELEWLCEESPLGPLYLLPTRPFVSALARALRKLGARRVLEVAAGDGFLARALGRAAPDLAVWASDTGAWERPQARMNAAERRALAGRAVPGLRLGEGVLRLGARAAVRRTRPDVVLVSWLPPGLLLDQLVRLPVRYVLEIGAGSGITASAWSWRYRHEFLEGPIEATARCRLDVRPARALHSRVTLYYGRAHPDFAVERVARGDWLWQFRPRG
jgi:hypothetical protein